jgi:riboflavin kinase/FMN adenylyltransferase
MGAAELARRPPAAATIGVFDGVHRGHQELLARVSAAARNLGGRAVAVTFARHPLAVLDPGRCPAPLTTIDERRALLAASGIDDVIVLDFDLAMSRRSAREFLDLVLLERYALKVLVAGPDFAMGRDRAGDLAALTALGEEVGFTVEQVGPIVWAGESISSTRLRRALQAGEVDVARELLGRDYQLVGRVVTGHGRGRGLGFPTANLAVDEGKLLPGDGVYAALAAVGDAADEGSEGRRGSPRFRSAAVNVGRAPTFGDTEERRVEVHLLGGGGEPAPGVGDLTGRRLAVRFVARLRGERAFPDAEALRAQIAADVTAARDAVAARVAAEEAQPASPRAAPGAGGGA